MALKNFSGGILKVLKNLSQKILKDCESQLMVPYGILRRTTTTPLSFRIPLHTIL